ncbi:MAG: PaaI family thioesterase [Myxococcaceae bacterium]|nr:PaaI family thioesterase [Myxococcaceae bacterium]
MLENLDPAQFGQDELCFGCGPKHPIGFHLRCERADGGVVARFTPGTQFQGPPGIMHGGLVSTLADEIAAWTILAMAGKFGFTASFQARFHKPVRIGVEVLGRAKVVKQSSRVLYVDCELLQKEVLCFKGEFSFVVLDKQGAEKMLEGPLPPAWEKFCR